MFRKIGFQARTVFALAVVIGLGACGKYPTYTTGIEHQNDNLESSQVTWIPHTAFRGPNGVTFTQWDAPSVVQTHNIPTTENPIPITQNFIHGPTNTIALGQVYRPVNVQSKE
jgi:hypothetical protein